MTLAFMKGEADLVPHPKVDKVSKSFLKKTEADGEKGGVLTKHLPLLSKTKKRAIQTPN